MITLVGVEHIFITISRSLIELIALIGLFNIARTFFAMKMKNQLQLAVFIWKFANLINSAACSFYFIVPLLKIFYFHLQEIVQVERNTLLNMINAIILYLEIIILHTYTLQCFRFIAT